MKNTNSDVSRCKKWTRFWGILVFSFFILYLIRAIQADRDDFLAYYNAGLRALHGETPYRTEETPFRYLPVIAFFFTPFTFFSPLIARVLFFLTNFLITIAMYASFRKKIGDLATLLIAALFFRFHNHDFGNSQVNPILLGLFFYWINFRESRLLFASLAFGVFGSMKILPFALGLPLVVSRRWNEILLITLWVVVVNFLPIFFYSSGPLIFQDWILKTKEVQDPMMLSNVQSLQSALWWNLKDSIDPKNFTIFMRGIQSALLLYAVVYTPKRNREAWMIATTLAITVISSPLAWKHGYLLFIPLVYQWFSEDPLFKEMRTRILYGMGGFGFVILPTLLTFHGREFADRLYLMPWTGLLLILLGPWLARRA